LLFGGSFDSLSCMKAIAVCLAAVLPCLAQLASGPPLPHKVVQDWAQLPPGMNFGECSGVSVDKDDNIWVFHRGAAPIMQFDKKGNLLRKWGDGLIKSAHGIEVDNQGNIWAVDVEGHTLFKFNPGGRIQMVIGRGAGNDDSKDAFNRPTGLVFAPNGDFFVADGYVNSRVVKFNKDGEHLLHFGSKGTGDGQFDLVHDVALDAAGRLYVADRTNERVQIFDQSGKFLGKWTGIGAPWGLHYAARENAMYMADGKNNRIIKLNLDGQVQGVLGSYGRTQGKLDFAHHLAVDSEGSIYVVEIKNWRVQKFAR
jgi:DNA-binding beta-propeller fold protein YncE